MIDVLVVGMGFGAHFVPVWMAHPDVRRVGVVDRNAAAAKEAADRLGLDDWYTSLEDAFATGRFDAVHLVTPPTMHAEQAIQVLESGRHCAVAVPMGMTTDDLMRVIDTVDGAAGSFMMFETAVFQPEYFYARRALDAGELGDITFLSGMHLRDRNGMPGYWKGWPPLKYATHAISPLLALANTRARSVQARGSGQLAVAEQGEHGNPFPIETALYDLVDSDVIMQVTQACFQFAREAYEGFSVYGNSGSIEWPQQGLALREHRMPAFVEQDTRAFRAVTSTDTVVEPAYDILSGELAELAISDAYTTAQGERVQLGRPHGGSHPLMIHEFVRSIEEARASSVDERTAAEWCAAGIVGHESALRNGETLPIPDFRR